MWHGYAVTSSTLLADPPSNETIDVFYINKHLKCQAVTFMFLWSPNGTIYSAVKELQNVNVHLPQPCSPSEF